MYSCMYTYVALIKADESERHIARTNKKRRFCFQIETVTKSLEVFF